MRHGLVVLLLGERVHRAELLAAAHRGARPARASDSRSSSGSALGGGLRLEPEAAGQLVQVALGVRGRVAHLLRRHLGGGHGLARALQASLELRLLLRAGLRARRRSPRRRRRRPRAPAPSASRRAATASHALSSAAAARSASPARARSRSAPVRRAASERARSSRSRSMRSASRCSARRSPSSSARRTASGPSSGASRRRAITHSERLHDLLGLGRLAQRGAQRALGGLACRVGLGDRGAVALHALRGPPPRSRDGLLGGGHQLVAPAELLEQPLGAAGGRLRQLAGAGVEEASRLRDGDAAEACREARRATPRPTRRRAAAPRAPRPPARDAQVAQEVARRAPKERPERAADPERPD